MRSRLHSASAVLLVALTAGSARGAIVEWTVHTDMRELTPQQEPLGFFETKVRFNTENVVELPDTTGIYEVTEPVLARCTLWNAQTSTQEVYDPEGAVYVVILDDTGGAFGRSYDALYFIVGATAAPTEEGFTYFAQSAFSREDDYWDDPGFLATFHWAPDDVHGPVFEGTIAPSIGIGPLIDWQTEIVPSPGSGALLAVAGLCGARRRSKKGVRHA